MRLKRRDLVEEFELIVKQEIKNHNDLMQATNQALDSLRKHIDRYTEQHREDVRELRNQVDQNLHLHGEHQEGMRLCLYRLTKLENDYEQDQGRQDALIEELQEENLDLSKRNNILGELLMREQEKRQEEVLELRRAVDDMRQHIERQMEYVRAYSRERDEAMLTTIEAALSDHKDQLMKQMECCRVDVKGIDENLAKKQKRINYHEKQIECLMNRVDRLRKEA